VLLNLKDSVTVKYVEWRAWSSLPGQHIARRFHRSHCRARDRIRWRTGGSACPEL